MGINDKKQLAEAERAQSRRGSWTNSWKQGVGFADPARVDIRGTLDLWHGCLYRRQCRVRRRRDTSAMVRPSSRTTWYATANLGPGLAGSFELPYRGCDNRCTDCEIGPFARLRPGRCSCRTTSKIGNFVEVKKSTIADGSKVNHLTYIGDSRRLGRASTSAPAQSRVITAVRTNTRRYDRQRCLHRFRRSISWPRSRFVRRRDDRRGVDDQQGRAGRAS